MHRSTPARRLLQIFLQLWQGARAERYGEHLPLRSLKPVADVALLEAGLVRATSCLPDGQSAKADHHGDNEQGQYDEDCDTDHG